MKYLGILKKIIFNLSKSDQCYSNTSHTFFTSPIAVAMGKNNQRMMITVLICNLFILKHKTITKFCFISPFIAYKYTRVIRNFRLPEFVPSQLFRIIGILLYTEITLQQFVLEFLNFTITYRYFICVMRDVASFTLLAK